MLVKIAGKDAESQSFFATDYKIKKDFFNVDFLEYLLKSF